MILCFFGAPPPRIAELLDESAPPPARARGCAWGRLGPFKPSLQCSGPATNRYDVHTSKGRKIHGNIYIHISTFKISRQNPMKAYEYGLRDTPYIEQM